MERDVSWFEDVKRLRNEFGYSLFDANKALRLCSSYEVAVQFLLTMKNAVYTYKFVNGHKVSWNEKDYADEAERIIKEKIEDENNERVLQSLSSRNNDVFDSCNTYSVASLPTSTLDGRYKEI